LSDPGSTVIHDGAIAIINPRENVQHYADIERITVLGQIVPTSRDTSLIVKAMGKRERDLLQQSIYLEPEKAKLLDELSTESRIPKAVLLREAVDDLLVKHRRLKAPKRKP
jgi:ribbon-helix-helix protein